MLHGYLAAAIYLLIAGVSVFGAISAFPHPAEALPSFARQTGQPCGKCHTDFPALTPFGRRFKLLGYTIGGGEFRTTPFPSADDTKAAADKMRSYAKSMDAGGEAGADKGYVPPISMMAIVGFTHTQASVPGQDPFKSNDNTVLAPFSAFWGGAITDNIGAFAQVTYTGPPAGGFQDPFGHTWTWDNTDVRYAKSLTLGKVDMVFGITANNNPTVQDVWNTTPAWSFPYAASTIGSSGPSVKTMIEGAFAAHVGGVGAYAFINDMLYLEASGYKTLGFKQQNAVGVDPFGAPGLIDGVAPYWRAALEPHWGDHSLMVGTFGMHTEVRPWIDTSFASFSMDTLAQTDKFTDAGFDAQYQYQGENFWLTLRGSYIREFQRLDATFGVNGASSNLNNELNSLKLQGSLAYGGDNKVVLTGQYFDTWGSTDPLLYQNLASGISPNSNGFTAEVAYIPFGTSKAPGWPWFNARVGLQYTAFNKFEGTKTGASDHNTLFLHLWLAM
jgi:hypothetical protein